MTNQLEKDVNLKPYHSFGCEVQAAEWGSFDSLESWQYLMRHSSSQRHLILGGGSNVLFERDYDGCVLHNAITGIDLVKTDDQHVWVRVGAGENWHQLVMYTVAHGWGGLENLSLIPGNVGASPMQNIGAYGVEVKQVIDRVEAWHRGTHAWHSFTNADCAFGYRESIFKTSLRDQMVIGYVTFKLSLHPVVNTSYGAIQQELENVGIAQPGIREVSEAVMRIRSSKLPDPKVLGNAGSFFKNPVVPAAQADALKAQHPDMPVYAAGEGLKKLAAGWLIERCGLKGYRQGDAGMHERQALVLVNYGKASGPQLMEVARLVQHTVYQQFGIHLEQEVNLIA